MTEPAPRKSDLGVRVLSAVVMIAVAGTALWLGGWFWTAFVVAVATVCLSEFIRLIWLATASSWKRLTGSAAAFAYVGWAGLALAYMRHRLTDDVGGWMGFMSVLAVLGIVIFTDIGAYFSGRAIGGPKIATKISPSKTWAGLFGGMAAASLWSVLALQLWVVVTDYESGIGRHQLPEVPIAVPLIGAMLAVLAQVGDFFQSWLKRRAGVKDSSNLIPGHGGIFDRVDGLIPVVLVASCLTVPPF